VALTWKNRWPWLRKCWPWSEPIAGIQFSGASRGRLGLSNGRGGGKGWMPKASRQAHPKERGVPLWPVHGAVAPSPKKTQLRQKKGTVKFAAYFCRSFVHFSSVVFPFFGLWSRVYKAEWTSAKGWWRSPSPSLILHWQCTVGCTVGPYRPTLIGLHWLQYMTAARCAEM